MIDAELQTLAKPHLEPGEFVIWAEKTSPEAIKKEDQEELRNTKIMGLVSLFLIFVLILSFTDASPVSFKMKPPIDHLIFLVFGALLLFGISIWHLKNAIMAIKSPKDFMLDDPEMGYILTPGRLLIAYSSGEVYSAATLKPPTRVWLRPEWKLPFKWKRECMMIYPTKGKGISVSYIYLYYLADFKASQFAIEEAVITHQKQ